MRRKHNKAERTVGRGANFRRRATQGLMGTRGPTRVVVRFARRTAGSTVRFPEADPADQEIVRCL